MQSHTCLQFVLEALQMHGPHHSLLTLELQQRVVFYCLVDLGLFLQKLTNTNRKMLTNALRALVNNPFKESFYGEKKKKTIKVLTVFFISHKSCVKTFQK